MIGIPQIKAARSLLGWTQRDLAKASGVSLAAIAQIERGAGNPRLKTMEVLQKTFEAHDIEFSDDPGVRIQSEPFSVKVWQGREAILKVWADIEATFSNGKGGEILLSSMDNPLWEGIYPKELQAMIFRREKLRIHTRALVSKPEDMKGARAVECRLVPKAVYNYAPYYVYGDKVALIKLRSPIRVVVIKNATVVDSFRGQFLHHWENGKKV